jgi:LysR family transcriptional regulator, cyn operon transcriptional activator
MDLDPRYLQAFLEVGRARSFSRAAATLHKTQPAVSYQIRQLEQQLGATLFDRSTRNLTTTPAGAALLAMCERFFGEFERLAAMLREPAAFAPEPLRIASVSGFGRYVLFPILAGMPALQYSLRYPTADQVFASLHEGTCDVGFVYLPIVTSRFLTTVVWREELVLLAPARSRFPATVDAFTELAFVTYDESEYVFGKWFETLYGRQPRSLRSAYHFEELEEVVSTVAAGRGWSIVPADCARATKGTVILRHRRRRVRNLIYQVTRAGGHEHPATAQLVELLRARA